MTGSKAIKERSMKQDDESTALVQYQDDPFIQMVERLAANPDIDADKLERVLAVQEKILDRTARDEFYAAISRVQAILPTVKTDAWNDQTKSRYARLSAISRAITPIYTAEGFSASFWEGKDAPEGSIRIEGILRHRDGHSEPYGANLALDDVGIKGNVNKTKVHGTGSTFTYGRRYLKCMMFDIAVGDDDDAQAKVETISEEQAADLNALIDEIGLTPSRKAAFMRWAKIEETNQLPADDFNFAVKYLKKIGIEA